MSAERDKAILIFGSVFIAGMITGAGGLVWLLNRECNSDKKKT